MKQSCDISSPDFQIRWAYFNKSALKMNPRFVNDLHNIEVNQKMVGYFSKYLETNLDRKKGLLIVGPTGTGKSTLFMTFQKIIEDAQPGYFLKMQGCREIKDLWKTKDWKIINQLKGRNENRQITNPVKMELVLDDLGMDVPFKDFGTEVDLTGDILEARYNIFRDHGIRTHATTNLSTALKIDGKVINEIEARYGTRVYSRIREMFNILVLGGPDRRG